MIFVGGFVVSYYMIKQDSCGVDLLPARERCRRACRIFRILIRNRRSRNFPRSTRIIVAVGHLGASLVSFFSGRRRCDRNHSPIFRTNSPRFRKTMANARMMSFAHSCSRRKRRASTRSPADLANIQKTLAAIDADSNQLSGVASYFGGASPVSGEELSCTEDAGGRRGKFFECVRAVALRCLNDASHFGVVPESFGDAAGRRIFGKLCRCFDKRRSDHEYFRP